MDLDFLRTTLSHPRTKDQWATIANSFQGDPVAILGELIPRAVSDPTDPEAPKPDPVIVARLVNAAAVLVRVAANPAADVSVSDAADLLLLRDLAGRPAIPVRQGRYTTAPPQWTFLDAARINPRLGSVGRIDAPLGTQVGTGFLVGPAVIMTNRHVVVQLRDRNGGVLPPSATIDFDIQDSSGKRPTAHIVEELWVSNIVKVDLALLRIEGDDLPPPLFIQTTPPNSIDGQLVYAVGYPAADNEGTTPDAVMAAVFRDALGIKRMQPGKLRGLGDDPRRVLHDCSTLGGSSGSCIIDYASGVVCGLHYAGRYEETNRAVALWTVIDHEKIAPHIPR